MATQLPTYFISHGGGPWPWLKSNPMFDTSILEASLQRLPAELPATPRAILAISGHWEESTATVMTSPHPPMVYDYSGFPAHTYQIQYPAPGSPEVAARVQELLAAAGIPSRADAHRGFDHGVFAPMYVAWPNADVPILQLSILSSYSPAAHLALGRALASLRDEGVLILASGLSYHNMRGFGPAGARASADFDRWLTDTLCHHTGAERDALLLDWDRAPSARAAHPQEDHLIPLMVAVGAAENSPATVVYHEENFAGGITASSFRFD